MHRVLKREMILWPNTSLEHCKSIHTANQLIKDAHVSMQKQMEGRWELLKFCNFTTEGKKQGFLLINQEVFFFEPWNLSGWALHRCPPQLENSPSNPRNRPLGSGFSLCVSCWGFQNITGKSQERTTHIQFKANWISLFHLDGSMLRNSISKCSNKCLENGVFEGRNSS